MSDDTLDNDIWTVAKRLFQAERDAAQHVFEQKITDECTAVIQAFVDEAETLIAGARGLGLTAADLANIADNKAVVVPVERIDNIKVVERMYGGASEVTLVFAGIASAVAFRDALCARLDAKEPGDA